MLVQEFTLVPDVPLEALVVRESVLLYYLAALVDRPLGLDDQGCHANAWYASDLVKRER